MSEPSDLPARRFKRALELDIVESQRTTVDPNRWEASTEATRNLVYVVRQDGPLVLDYIDSLRSQLTAVTERAEDAEDWVNKLSAQVRFAEAERDEWKRGWENMESSYSVAQGALAAAESALATTRSALERIAGSENCDSLCWACNEWGHGCERTMADNPPCAQAVALAALDREGERE